MLWQKTADPEANSGVIRHCAPPRRHSAQSSDWLLEAARASSAGTQMFLLLHSARGTWIVKGASSERLSPRDTRSRDESRQTCAENHGAAADNGQYRTAVRRPPSSAIGTDGPHDRFGSPSLSLWPEASGPLVPEARPMSHSVKSQDADKIFPNRNQSGLAELRFPNGQCRLPEIHIFMLQASRLTQAQPCSVEHDDQRAHGVWGQGACWRVVRIRNSQQPTDIFS